MLSAQIRTDTTLISCVEMNEYHVYIWKSLLLNNDSAFLSFLDKQTNTLIKKAYVYELIKIRCTICSEFIKSCLHTAFSTQIMYECPSSFHVMQ